LFSELKLALPTKKVKVFGIFLKNVMLSIFETIGA